jgi:hypothetical protein
MAVRTEWRWVTSAARTAERWAGSRAAWWAPRRAEWRAPRWVAHSAWRMADAKVGCWELPTAAYLVGAMAAH